MNDSRVKLQLPVGAIGKEPDAAVCHNDTMPTIISQDLAGSIIVEGSAFNESFPELLKEHLWWHSSPNVKVSVFTQNPQHIVSLKI